MGFSHRDHRAERTVRQAFWAVVGAVAAISATAALAPTPVLGLICLAALATIGGVYLLGSERALTEYTEDLAATRGGGEVSGWLRVEAGHELRENRSAGAPNRRSPHTRIPTGRPRPAPPVIEPEH
jgi:hypothetical protein